MSTNSIKSRLRRRTSSVSFPTSQPLSALNFRQEYYLLGIDRRVVPCRLGYHPSPSVYYLPASLSIFLSSCFCFCLCVFFFRTSMAPSSIYREQIAARPISPAQSSKASTCRSERDNASQQTTQANRQIWREPAYVVELFFLQLAAFSKRYHRRHRKFPGPTHHAKKNMCSYS